MNDPADQPGSGNAEREARDPDAHQYLSTSCLHADADGRPELHVYCRSRTGSNGVTEWAKEPSSCKFCGASCTCWCHTTPVSRDELAYLARDWGALAHLARDWDAQATQEERRLGSRSPRNARLFQQKAEILRACAEQLRARLGVTE
jgi:hypothetical protein